MRKYLLIFGVLFLSIPICATAIPRSSVKGWEEGGYYSMGIASKQRLYDFAESLQKAEREMDVFSSEETISEAEEREEGTVFTRDGAFTKRFDRPEEEAEAALRLEKKVLSEGEIDYRSFAFIDRAPALSAPLTEEEVAWIFYEIILSSSASLPVQGRLADLSFVRKGDRLLVAANISLDLSELSEQSGLSWIPRGATFFVAMGFDVRNTEISVDLDATIVRCESFELPEALLVFGCGAFFGKRDYKTLFGRAVANVFITTGIYE